MKTKSYITSVIAALISALIAASAQAAGAPAAAPLTIFHADSLAGYMTRLAADYQASHPGVEVRHEGSGSLDAIRKISDLGRPCDILVTADWRLLKTARKGIEPWAITFAGNAMGIVYTAHSRAADKIAGDNWWRVLLEPGVRFGHSNPERDPAGYWTLIVWQLAERFYHQPGLAERLAADCPVTNIRPHSIDLIALLQSGELDYYFGYASDARLGDLKFLALPVEINLSEIARSAEYGAASVRVGTGANQKEIVGAPVAYALTLTSDPPNRAGAMEFIRMMLGAPGRKAAADFGLIAYPDPIGWDPEHRMPAELRAIVKPAAN
ncbi:MAG TPA: extracellular solute-binding protein [Candidatus Binataceae bacterium]|nr:extracellular solute-binding protein [Candidatus Binataceae bacterium]